MSERVDRGVGTARVGAPGVSDPRTLPALALLLFLGALPACSTAAAEDSDSSESHLEDTCEPSPLFAKMTARAQDVARAGLVPPSLLVTQHNTADKEVLIGGPAIFDAVADLIAAAEHDVELQTWRWDVGSDPSLRIIKGIKRLEARRRAQGAASPVVVRLLLNRVLPVADTIVGKIYTQITAEPIDPQLIDLQVVDFQASGILGADHAKTVTVDGTETIVMGANVTEDYGKNPDMWDAGFRMRGEVAQSIHADFAKMWGDGRQWLCARKAEPARDPEGVNAAPGCWSPPAKATTTDVRVPGACMPMLVATHPRNGAPFPRANNDNPQAQVFLSALELAERQVLIQSPNLNEDAIKKAIVSAVRRGITVRLLLSMKFEETAESLPGRGGGNEATAADLYQQLEDLPSACSRLQIHWYSKDGKVAVEGTRPPASHVKYLSVDGQVVVVGSANQDVQSWRNSHELNVATDSADLTRAWDETLFGVAWDRSIVADRCSK